MSLHSLIETPANGTGPREVSNERAGGTEVQESWKDGVDRHRLSVGGDGEKVMCGPGSGSFLLLGPGHDATGDCGGPGGHPGPGAEKDPDLEAAAAAGREWYTL